MTDQTLFVDVYDVDTRIVQRVPRHWLDDALLGRNLRKTPRQRELDGELPERPAGDAKAADISAYVDAAGLDLTGARSNGDKLRAIEDAMGPAPVQAGVPAEDPVPAPADPLDPAVAANVGDAAPSSTPTEISDGTEPTDQNPPAGGDEE